MQICRVLSPSHRPAATAGVKQNLQCSAFINICGIRPRLLLRFAEVNPDGPATAKSAPSLGTPSQQFRSVQTWASSSAAGQGKEQPHVNVFGATGLISLVLISGVANRVFYKLALVPMHNYIWFLAQVQNLCYLAVYFTALYLAYRSGRATNEMLAIDKGPFVRIGICEAASQLLFMIAAAELPGALIPLLGQVYMLWNILFAYLLLGSRFSLLQVLGGVLVVAGAVFAAAAPQVGSGLAGKAAQADLRYVLVGICCFAFPAAASCIKERIFRQAKQQLGRPLNIFVVNAFGSLAQSLFVLLLLPVSAAAHGMSLSHLPDYVAQGCACIMGGSPSCGADCSAAPLLPLLYVAANLIFNISILMLLRRLGTVTTSLIASCLVPLSIFAFTLPLPYLEPAHIGPGYLIGTCLLMSGVVMYNFASWLQRSNGNGSGNGNGSEEKQQ